MDYCILKSKRGRELRLVELAYAVLHVICHGTPRMSGKEATRRLLAGETLDAGEFKAYRSTAVPAVKVG